MTKPTKRVLELRIRQLQRERDRIAAVPAGKQHGRIGGRGFVRMPSVSGRVAGLTREIERLEKIVSQPDKA